MDYFSLLNLKKEPFSNSPDPDFFYRAPGHVECLQKLELTIRLRQGLAVVLGDVGTGKTTLCRQLIRRLGHGDLVDTHLILDPSFGSAREFLETITATLNIDPPTADDSDRRVKERIKNFLFDRAVAQGRIVVLLIDEGQKLPDFCLEILRELLNYETNNAKLLQIVIFAQEEFRHQMAAMANFTDRIATLQHLEPLDFRETRNMIRFRLQQASDNQRMVPDLFNRPALLLIWWVTRGYPRKIVMLCSKALLTMIIQNGSRVTAALVLACYRRMGSPRRSRLAMAAVLLVITALLAMPAVRLLGPPPPGESSAEAVATVGQPKSAAPQPSQPSSVGDPAPQPNRSKAVPTPPPKNQSPAAPFPKPIASSASPDETHPLPSKTIPGVITDKPKKTGSNRPDLGRLRIAAGDNLSKMIARVYGHYDWANLKLVRAANPKLTNINTIPRNTTIVFPAALPPTPPPQDGRFRLLLGRFSSLDTAYAFVKAYPESLPPVRILAMTTPDIGLHFLVVVEKSFASRTEAERVRRGLAPTYQATIFDQWEKESLLLSKLPEWETK